MKKCSFLLLMLVLLLCAAHASAETTLPKAIEDYFTQSTIIDAAFLPDYADTNHYFILAKTEKQENVLHYFKMQNNEWKHIFQTSQAVPQGSKTVMIQMVMELNDNFTGQTYPGPLLTLYQLDEHQEYTELFTAYQYTGTNQWSLFRIWSHSQYHSMIFSDGKVSYFQETESSRIAGSVYGTIQRDLRYVSLSAVPKTLKEARNKYTQAPSIPSGEMEAEKIKFTGGRKYAVYSGPGEDYLRGAKGKAIVSTNDWIQVFGREGDWILIQYAIDKDHMRFGYIPADALPRNASVAPTGYAPVTAYTSTALSLTDDPLFSQASLAALPADAAITWYATMGEWAYVEWMGDALPVRGFVPLSALQHLSRQEAIERAKAHLLATQPMAAQESVTADMLETYACTAQYDAARHSWIITLDSGRDYRWIITLDDRTGQLLSLDATNG